MGNSIGGGRKRAKVMKVNGEVFKLKTPVRAGDVVGDYPGHVLMDAEAVKHFGIRARPMEPQQELKPRKVYFLVEMPMPSNKFNTLDLELEQQQQQGNNIRRAYNKPPLPLPGPGPGPRSLAGTPLGRVRSGINMTAKDRLEFLMLARRSASDITFTRTSGPPSSSSQRHLSREPTQLKLRIPRSQLDRLVEESTDGVDVAEKILDLYLATTTNSTSTPPIPISHQEKQKPERPLQPVANSTGFIGGSFRAHHHQKRVSFSTVEESKDTQQLPPLMDI